MEEKKKILISEMAGTFMDNLINSHIQISKLLLKPFAHKTEEGLKVWYLNLENNTIAEEKINTLDTELGYYDEDVENLFAEAETAFGDIAKKFKEFESKKINPTISPKEFDVISRFIQYALLRNTQIAQALKEGSFFLDDNSTHSDVIRYCEVGEPALILKGYKANVLVNKTDRTFVIPKNVLYEEKTNGQEIYIMPIAPKVAIVMMPIDMFNGHIKNGILEHAETIDGNLIERLNSTAYRTEKETSNKFVVGLKEELEMLQKLNILK